MHVLVTGSTANQTSQEMAKNSINFTGLLKKSLESTGASVTWQDPSLSISREELDQYDKILVGLANPLSLSSNRIYGALNIVNELWESPKLNLFIDAPDPGTLTRGFSAVRRNPSSLYKEFFSRRPGYEALDSPATRIKMLAACDKILHKKWPTTLIPAFPWTVEAQVAEDLPRAARNSLVLCNFDRYILREAESHRTPDVEREERWMAEKIASRAWLRGLELTRPVISLRSNTRVGLTKYTCKRLGTSTGLLHAPMRGGKVWWSPKVAISLSQRTPVFTNWRESKALGKSWAVLPSAFEDMSEIEQASISKAQYETYLNSLPNSGQIKTYMANILDMESEAL